MGVVSGRYNLALKKHGMLCSTITDAMKHWDYGKVVFSVVVCLSVQEVSVKTKIWYLMVIVEMCDSIFIFE